MGHHNFSNPNPANRNSPRRTIAKVVAALVVVTLCSWGLVAVLRQNSVRPAAAGACPDTTTVRVMTSTSFAPVLQDLAPSLARSKVCLRLEVKVVDGRPALGALAASSADVWIPDDGAWAMTVGDDVLAPRGQAGARTVLATSPIYQVTDPDTAERITAAGGSWFTLSGMLSGGSGMTLAVRDPATSGDGMVAFGSLGEAVWLKKGMDSATVASVAIRGAGRTVTGDGPALPTRAGEVGLVPEYALIPALGSGTNMTVLSGSDRTAMLRFTWLPLAAAVADLDRRAALAKLLDALTSSSAERALAAAGLRRPNGGPPPNVPAARLPELTDESFEVMVPHHVDHVFAAWYPQERRANLLLAVDASGSMNRIARGTSTSLIRLAAQGCTLVGAMLPDDARLAVWDFSTLIDPPRDHRVLLESGPLTSAHRKRLAGAVGQLQGQPAGTGLYDTILAAYRSAVASFQPGMPNQVLVITDALHLHDSQTITISQLTSKLRASADPARPVSLTVAAFSSEPDRGFKAALESVKGSLVRIDSGQQIAAVMVHAGVGGLR